MKKICTFLLCLSLLLVSFAGCSGKESPGKEEDPGNYVPPEQNNVANNASDAERFPTENDETHAFQENPFIATQEHPVSTFSADVDTASYSYFRKLINSGYTLPDLLANGSSFRTEEFINYFRYQANTPAPSELFGVTTTIADCPWNPDTVLMRLTLQAADAIPTEGGNNLVFLIDVSGSMSSADKLPLLKTAFSFLVDQLTENDRVSIVTYSGIEDVILEGCPGNDRERILEKINSLTAKGVTNGSKGLMTAYEVAEENRIENGNNRIIMASDGDLNVGITSQEQLKKLVESKRDNGVYLSVLGFGTGNYRDSKMETLADNGNGVYYYIDGISEAEKVFGTDLFSTLYTVANDVKLQITFNPSAVSSYRLIGYENRLLNDQDFNDDTKDAGEVGAGHQVTVFYELTLTTKSESTEPWMTLAVRYKRPGETTSSLNEYPIGISAVTETPDDDFAFMTALIETGMILHRSAYLKEDGIEGAFERVLGTLSSLDLSDLPDRAEFLTLLERIKP